MLSSFYKVVQNYDERRKRKEELDGITLHVCHKQQPEQLPTKEPEEQQPAVSDKLSKEIAAIKAQLLELVSRLDHI